MPTHCVISYVIPSPTLVLAVSNEQRPFLSCFLAAHMPNSNCSPGTDNCLYKTQKERSSVCMYTLFIGQDLMKLALDSYSKCNIAHTRESIQRDPGFNTNRILAAISQSWPFASFWLLPGISLYWKSKRQEKFPLPLLSSLSRATNFYQHHFSNQCTSSVLERALCFFNQFSVGFVSFLRSKKDVYPWDFQNSGRWVKPT